MSFLVIIRIDIDALELLFLYQLYHVNILIREISSQ